MRIIKEYCPEAKLCVIRTDTYAHSYDFIQQLFECAKRDFPELDPKQVEVVEFAGRRYARTYGIEFSVGDKPIPSEYEEIRQLEYTF